MPLNHSDIKLLSRPSGQGQAKAPNNAQCCAPSFSSQSALFNDNALLARGLETIEREGQALALLYEALKGPLAPAFLAALELIKNAKGRTIVTGLGKSGHIGSKLAASFASTGTPAFFVHAAEANHGDLGMIRQEDVLLALSWSGATIELAGILRHAARFSIPLIGITAQPSSLLGREADILLLLPKADEACPHGLAPTTSTIMQLALGDALALALLQARGFSADDFKIFHPGGSLGAKLKFIGDIMHRGDSLPLVKCGTNMRDAMKILSQKHFGCVAIIADDGKLQGIITEGDLVRHLDHDLAKARVEDIMTRDPKFVTPQTMIGKAIALINKYQISALLVVENQIPVGIVHFHDLLRQGAL